MADDAIVILIFGLLMVAIVRLALPKSGRRRAPAPFPSPKKEKSGPSIIGGIVFIIIISLLAMWISSLGFNGLLVP